MAEQKGGDGLLRWLFGGLVAGGVMLGLLIGAYAIGYHRGQAKAEARLQQARPARPSERASIGARTERPPAKRRPAPAAPSNTSSADLVAEGKRLHADAGCSACHSLDGSPGAGPTFRGLAGSSVELADGTTVTGDDA